MIVGAMTVFEEARNIGAAVASLVDVGCDMIVCLDGAWNDSFGGRGPLSEDGTREEATNAGALWLEPDGPIGDDGAKRNMLLRLLPTLGVTPGDHLLLLDADERVYGRLHDSPAGHGMVLLRNEKPNDLPGVRTGTLDPSQRPIMPLLRWLRYSTALTCDAPGRYREHGTPIEPYLVNQLRDRVNARPDDSLVAAAYRVARDVEPLLHVGHLTTFPVVDGITIHHSVEATPERVAAKRAYYLPEA